MQTFDASLKYLVPLQSIYLARISGDALAEYEATGKAVGFTPGELRSIADLSDDAYTGFLRAPTADETPTDPAQ